MTKASINLKVNDFIRKHIDLNWDWYDLTWYDLTKFVKYQLIYFFIN